MLVKTDPQPTFPKSYWDPECRVYLGMATFLENSAWKNVNIAPPPTTPELIQREIEELLIKQYDRDTREARRPDIMEECDAVTPKFQRGLLFNDKSHPFTAELITSMVIGGRPAIFHFKNLFNRARPTQICPDIEPMIEVPGHPAYPSGHSFQTHLIAHALSEIAPEAKDRLFDIANTVAENREWAGVHYSSDSRTGRDLAQEVFPAMRYAFAEIFEAAKKEW